MIKTVSGLSLDKWSAVITGLWTTIDNCNGNSTGVRFPYISVTSAITGCSSIDRRFLPYEICPPLHVVFKNVKIFEIHIFIISSLYKKKKRLLYVCTYVRSLTGSHSPRQNLTMTLNRTIWLSGNLKAVNVEIKERLSAGSFNSAGKVVESVGHPDWSRRRYEESPDSLLATRCPAAMS